jgi:undecaprenyl diphosphate synthase
MHINSLKEHIDKNKLPQHIAIIMDGNGRWAKKQGLSRIFGHRQATQSVKDVTEASAELGIPYLTLYTFSTENWNRPQEEVNALMNLLVDTIKKELPTLQKNNIKLNAIGNLKQLPKKVFEKLMSTIQQTSNNSQLTLTLALSYSSHWEITEMVKKIASHIKKGEINVDDITENIITESLATFPIPNPDLLIRTSGEYRISNFLLYQLAYTELYFTKTLWPDFSKDEFYKAILDFQSRERRYGLTTEQLKNE